MRKTFRVSLFRMFIVAVLFISLGNKVSANSCNVSCKFSSCSVNCTDPCAVGCGCYFGIASCKTEFRKADTKTVNAQAISDFGGYVSSINNVELIALYDVLKNLKADETYDTVFDQYKAKVEQLSPENKTLLEQYLAN